MRRTLIAGLVFLVACVGDVSEPSTGSVASPPPPPPGGAQGARPLIEAPASCETPRVAPTRLGRITRSQYQRSVELILGVAPPRATDLPPDELVGPFFGNLVSPVSDLNVEQYSTVAEDVADRALTERAGALLPCDPTSIDDACLQTFVQEMGRRVYRRPLTASETASYGNLVEQVRGLDQGPRFVAQVLLQAMLQSPNFLYRVEMPASTDGAIVEVDPYMLASRLSFFLWDSAPDDPLLDAAERGLGQDELVAEVDRLMAHANFSSMLESFHTQWLGLAELDTLEKDTTLFPQWNDGLREAMRFETLHFIDHVIREGDGSLDTLLTANFSFLTPELGEVYGVTLPSGHDVSEPVTLDPSQRAGLLTHASTLATHAHPDQTSPVHRGVGIRENFLCHLLPPPPPSVNDQAPEIDPNATTRERFAQHNEDPACAACHQLMDPIGLGFENYDALGAYREDENGLEIDASGELVHTVDIDGPFTNGMDLVQSLAGSEQVHQCVTLQWFRYALGRPESELDDCSVWSVYRSFDDSSRDVRELIRSITISDAFRYQATVAPDPDPLTACGSAQ
ncbi:MAG: DUF1588 domain-containing protein [Myxococcota bacterium]